MKQPCPWPTPRPTHVAYSVHTPCALVAVHMIRPRWSECRNTAGSVFILVLCRINSHKVASKLNRTIPYPIKFSPWLFTDLKNDPGQQKNPEIRQLAEFLMPACSPGYATTNMFHRLWKQCLTCGTTPTTFLRLSRSTARMSCPLIRTLPCCGSKKRYRSRTIVVFLWKGYGHQTSSLSSAMHTLRMGIFETPKRPQNLKSDPHGFHAINLWHHTLSRKLMSTINCM